MLAAMSTVAMKIYHLDNLKLEIGVAAQKQERESYIFKIHHLQMSPRFVHPFPHPTSMTTSHNLNPSGSYRYFFLLKLQEAWIPGSYSFFSAK